MTGQTRESLFARIRPLLLILAPVVVFVGVMAAPDEMCERVTACHWEVEGARILPGGGRGILLVHLYRRGRKRQASYNKLVTVDLATGARLGQHVTSDWVEPFGLTRGHIWLRHGGVRRKQWTGYTLPGLAEAYDLEELLAAHPEAGWPPRQVRLDPDGGEALLLQGREQGWYSLSPGDNRLSRRAAPGRDPWWNGALLPRRCEDPARPPRAVGNELLLDGVFVCDNITGRLLDLGGGDRLVACQDLLRETGKLILGRLAGGSRWAWRFHERERFGDRPREAHGYRVAFAAGLEGSLLLVLEQDDGDGDVWLVSLDPGDGRQQWAARYD